MCSNTPNKKAILKILMFVFKRAMIFLSKNDPVFKGILSQIPNGYTFSIEINFTNLSVAIKKENDCLTIEKNPKKPNLRLVFNNLCSAFLVFSGLLAQHTAFAQQRISIEGSISDALALTRAINRLQYIIFPGFISKRLLKEFKPPTKRERVLLVKFYLYGLVK